MNTRIVSRKRLYAGTEATFEKRDDGTFVLRISDDGADLARSGMAKAELEALLQQGAALLDVAPPPPPPPSGDLRPWVTPLRTTSELGERGRKFTLEPGRHYKDVRFLGAWGSAPGVILERCWFDGPNGYPSDAAGQRTTLLHVMHQMRTKQCKFSKAHGNSAVYIWTGGSLIDDGSWWVDNGHNANRSGGENDDSQFAHAIYLGAGGGDLRNGRIENQAAFGIHLYHGSEVVRDLLVDNYEVTGCGKAGIILATRMDNVRMTNMNVHHNGTYGVDGYNARVVGRPCLVQGRLRDNPAGPFEAGLDRIVKIEVTD